MNILQTSIMPKKVQTFDRSLQGPHFTILLIYLGSGRHPFGVQQCLTVIISSAQSIIFSGLRFSCTM